MNDFLLLRNQICFKHYVISKEIIKHYRTLLEPLDLTYTSYLIMLALWEKDNFSIKDLSETLFLDSGTLTPVLKKLETKKIISRNRNKIDERVVTIKLTEKGIALKEQAKEIPMKLVQSVFPGEVDVDAMQEHMKTLDQIIAILTPKDN